MVMMGRRSSTALSNDSALWQMLLSLERMRPSRGFCFLSNECALWRMLLSLERCAPQNMMLKSMVWLSHHLPLTFVLPSSLVVSCCLSASSIATMSPVLM